MGLLKLLFFLTFNVVLISGMALGSILAVAKVGETIENDLKGAEQKRMSLMN